MGAWGRAHEAPPPPRIDRQLLVAGEEGDNFFNGVVIARYPCSRKQLPPMLLQTIPTKLMSSRKTKGRFNGQRRESLGGMTRITEVNTTQVNDTHV